MSDERPPRTSAEWVTFGVALALLLGVLAAILSDAVREAAPAHPVAVVGETLRVGDVFHVAVTVENRGDKAATDVQVVATLQRDGRTVEADQVVDFLAGDDDAELTFVFDEDPSQSQLSVAVTGFSAP